MKNKIIKIMKYTFVVNGSALEMSLSEEDVKNVARSFKDCKDAKVIIEYDDGNLEVEYVRDVWDFA